MRWIYLDFGSYRLKALRVFIEGNKVLLEDYARWESKPEFFEGLGFPTTEAWQTMAQGLQELGWIGENSTSVVISNLPGAYLETRYVSFPFSSQKKIDKVLPLELESSIPFDLDEMLIKSQTLKPPIAATDQDKSLVLVMAYQRELIKKYEEEHRRFQLTIPSISVDILALTALRQATPAGTAQGFLSIGHKKTQWIFFGPNGQCVAAKTFWWGAESMQKELMKSLQIPESRARDLFVDSASLEVSTDSQSIHIRMTGALEESLNEFMNEFRQSLKGLQQNGIELPKPFPVYTLGSASRLPGLNTRLEERFRSEFGMSVQQFPLDNLESQISGLQHIEDPMSIMNCLGQALLQTKNHRGKVIHFSESNFQLQQNLRRFRSQSAKILRRVGILVLAPLLYLVTAFFLGGNEQEALRAQLQQSLAKAQLQFDESTPIETIKARLQKELISFRQKSEALREDENSPLMILSDLSTLLPHDLKIDIKEFRATETKVIIQANTDSAQSSDRILGMIQKVYPNAQKGGIENCTQYKGCKAFTIEFDRELRAEK